MTSTPPVRLRTKPNDQKRTPERTFECSSRAKLLVAKSQAQEDFRAFFVSCGMEAIYCGCCENPVLRVEIVQMGDSGVLFPRARPGEQSLHFADCAATAHTHLIPKATRSAGQIDELLAIARRGFDRTYDDQCRGIHGSRGEFCRGMGKHVRALLAAGKFDRQLHCAAAIMNNPVHDALSANLTSLDVHHFPTGHDQGIQTRWKLSADLEFRCDRNSRGTAMPGTHLAAFFWRDKVPIEFIQAWPIAATRSVHTMDSSWEDRLLVLAEELGLKFLKPPSQKFQEEATAADWTPVLRMLAAERILPDMNVLTKSGPCVIECAGYNRLNYNVRVVEKSLILMSLEARFGLQWLVLRPNEHRSLVVESRSAILDPVIETLVARCALMK